MKPSEMRSIMHAYSAVHSTDVKEELDSSRDQISEMRLTQLTDSDLVEVAEEILEGLFAGGFSVANTQSLLEAVLCESDIPGRQQKVERLQEAFSTVISKVKEKSARTAIESFAEYRHSKSVNEAWVNKFETDRGNVRLHNSLVAQDRLVIKTGLLQMLEKAKSPTTTKEDRGRDLARKAEADAKKRGLKVTDEEWKPYPKEKVERQKSRAYDKEMIARKGKRTDAKDKEADKQYERRIAMDGHPSKMRKVEEAQVARNNPEKYERDQEKKDTRSKKQKRMDDPDIGINSPAFKKFYQKMTESGKFSIEEIETILETDSYEVDCLEKNKIGDEYIETVSKVKKAELKADKERWGEEFKSLTPEKKNRIRNQAERRKKAANRAQMSSDYETSTKQDQQVRNMKKVSD